MKIKKNNKSLLKSPKGSPRKKKNSNDVNLNKDVKQKGISKKKNKIRKNFKNKKTTNNEVTLHQTEKTQNKINESQVHNNINKNKIRELLKQKKKETSNPINNSETLRERIISQLRASRFRFLNDTLYNNDSSESRKMFKEDPSAFKAYHEGYQYQVEQWSLNPLDVIINAVKKMPKEYVIADFGCGEGRLADSVKQKVHSIDLVAVNDKIIACDMAHTPLLTNGINAVVFCLSLMGTNLVDYILEANRVLKMDGTLKIAEISSRFDDVNEFINLLMSYGFKNTWTDIDHKYFYFMDFKKVKNVDAKCKKLPAISLKPCVYKKR
ncbi:GSCOCG00008591001-RA-CDS [Cotesia congregata]|uniref:Ribosomal RNA-processing protein 8 n=1 Tax=Cotesia congregata TaxID=51543 RepID=A0A8J2EHA6_COTCN|nr:GSCOCG00008591001-RA-CDS [Cotesia congregata]CAG5075503.1 Similar to Rrp8: Ribosomal RNA-processing protein 8 (Mus musculus) [Cotesia congregata]